MYSSTDWITFLTKELLHILSKGMCTPCSEMQMTTVHLGSRWSKIQGSIQHSVLRSQYSVFSVQCSEWSIEYWDKTNVERSVDWRGQTLGMVWTNINCHCCAAFKHKNLIFTRHLILVWLGFAGWCVYVCVHVSLVLHMYQVFWDTS